VDRLFRATISSGLAFASLFGCGGGVSTSPVISTGQSCSGISVTGTLRDSLTNQPVSQGWAALEAGAGTSISSPAVTFSPTQTVASGSTGAFQLCTPALTQPAVVVVDALDATGQAYPAFVTQVSATTDLGIILMGGCTLVCDIGDGQQQVSVPASIQGQVTSTPNTLAGYVTPQLALNALDGSGSIWALFVPPLNTLESDVFSTAASACTGQNQWCSAFTFMLPSQNPVTPSKGGYSQQAGVPGYQIYAVSTNPSSCAETSIVSLLSTSGGPLLGSPGVTLTAQPINFTGCH
jgi:hypothetical protein